MRINNLWRITNNYKEDVWVWIFETDATKYIFPIAGKLFKLEKGEMLDTEIARDKVQIGFRKGNTIITGWVSKPVMVETDRDVALSSKKEIVFAEHGMFDRVDQAKDVQFITSAQSNNLARKAVTWGLSKIPEVGGVISSVVGVLWKEQKPKVDDLIAQSEKRMRSWVSGQIDQLKRDDLEKLSKGFIKNLNEYFSAKTPESRLFWLRTNISHFNDHMPYFTSKNYTMGTVGIGVEVATLHIALLRERVLFAEELGIPEEERADHITSLKNLISEYKSYVINTAVPAEKEWRKCAIEPTDEVGLANNIGYYLRDTVVRQTYFYSDHTIGNQRNTSNSYVNKNYYLRQAQTSYANSLLTNTVDTANLWTLLNIEPDNSMPIPLNRLTWVGPCTGLIYKGGNEHGAVEDFKMNTDGEIHEIVVRAHNEVDYLEVIYKNGERSSVGNPKNGTEHRVKLEEGVYITKVETWWDWELIAIKFYMSDGSSSQKFGDLSGVSRYKQTAVLDNHILSGIQVEGKKEASIGNAMSFGFVLRPDFYEVENSDKNS